ncbi:MAG: sulfotransferase [Desulfobacteraceae bacterium]|nr:sulfotransferase [Desulfobacteraceae bacterium]
MNSIPYSFSQRLLHRILLGNRFVAEFCLDLQLSLTKYHEQEVDNSSHIFIAGLARSGTTILLRRFYLTQQFVSMTYRYMPFVLMPGVWEKLCSFSKKEIPKSERAHGDGIFVDGDSPEAFEEVFWKTCAGSAYIKTDCLIEHSPSDETLNKFSKYIQAILHNHSGNCQRYLSKNNNNILRLPALVRKYPHSMFLVPFREPLSQAYSLMMQHERFRNLSNPFVNDYMRWLGHYEFGENHRPFSLNPDSKQLPIDKGLNYWLTLWRNVYSYLEEYCPKEVNFICYETLCTDKGVTWIKLLEIAKLPAIALEGEQLVKSDRDVSVPVDNILLKNCEDIYERLKKRHFLNKKD